jgi:hypothetical protein
VVVGCLPAFKSLIANRAVTKRSNYSYSSGRSKSKVNSNSRLRNTSIPLGSFSNDTKCANGRRPNGTDSQEEIVKPDDADAIMVKNDVVSATSLSSYYYYMGERQPITNVFP